MGKKHTYLSVERDALERLEQHSLTGHPLHSGWMDNEGDKDLQARVLFALMDNGYAEGGPVDEGHPQKGLGPVAELELHRITGSGIRRLEELRRQDPWPTALRLLWQASRFVLAGFFAGASAKCAELLFG